jgi:hypothetical protein
MIMKVIDIVVELNNCYDNAVVVLIMMVTIWLW